MSQTTIQNQSAIRKGSFKIEIGDSFLSLVDIGAIRDPKFTSLSETQEVVFDNVDPLKKFVKGKKAQIEFSHAEINMSILAQFDAGMVNLTSIAGTPVTGATQTVESGDWAYNGFIELENQMGDGTANTISTVVGGTDGALVSETDYFKGFNGQGKYGIFIKDSATVTTLVQDIVITYNYTPSASKRITFVDQGTKVLKCVRLSNTDENGKIFSIDIENATNFSTREIDLARDDEDDVAVMAIQLQGDVVWIDDQQQTV